MSAPKFGGIGATQRVTPTDLPEYWLPRDLARIPLHCSHCGSGLLELDQDYREHGPKLLTCVMCSHVEGKVHQ